MRGSRARIGFRAAAAATVVAAAAAGCSGGGGSTAAPTGTPTATASPTGTAAAAIQLVSDVMAKADAAGTVRIQGTVTSSSTGTMTVSGQEQYSPGLEMSMSMQVQGQTMSEVLIGTTFYMDYPALSAEMGGKPWGRIDLGKADGALGSLSSLANTARTYNPTTQLRALIATGQVSSFGTETVDGQQATHYQGKLTVSQMLDQAYGLTAAQTRQLKDTLQATGVTFELIDLWVGANQLPVEVKYVARSAAGQVSTDMQLSDWGKPVEIGAPPASQVFDMTGRLATAAASAATAG